MTRAQSFAPVHTPPEVVLGREATAASDTYQLASTLYTLLAGHAPFETGTDDGVFSMLSRIQDDEVPPLDRADVPPRVVEVLRVAMAKDPADRFATTAAFGEALQQLQVELGFARTDLVTVAGATAPTTGDGPADHTVLLPDFADALAEHAARRPPPASTPSPAPPAPTPPPAAAAPPPPPIPPPPPPPDGRTPPPPAPPAPTAAGVGAPPPPPVPPPAAPATTPPAAAPGPGSANPGGPPTGPAPGPRRSGVNAVVVVAVVLGILALALAAFVVSRL
jgi:serine/threonine protein kinase